MKLTMHHVEKKTFRNRIVYYAFATADKLFHKILIGYLVSA